MDDATFDRIAADMANFVGDRMFDTLKRHCMTLPTAGMAATVGAMVVEQLATEVAIFTALSVCDEPEVGMTPREAYDAVLSGLRDTLADAGDGTLVAGGWAKVEAKIAEKRAQAA